MDSYYRKILNSIPDSMDFEFIPVGEESTMELALFNDSTQASILFEIKNKEPQKNEGYIFDPPSGIIPKNKEIKIKIKINPKNALVVISNAKITLDGKVSKVIKISSISKFPFLTLNQHNFDFGVIQIGKSTTKELILTNSENVPATFEITKTSEQPGKNPQVFFVTPNKGRIDAMSAFLLKIKFQTVFPGAYSFETFNIKTRGGNNIKFTCSGNCLSLPTWLNVKAVNFRSIPLGNQNTKIIKIYNDGDQSTEYQIFHNNDGAFKIKSTQGIIKAHSNLRINITFRPYETITYYERIFCVIKNHTVIPIDIYGSSHDLLNKSLILEQKYIDLFRYKLMNGLYFKKPNKMPVILDSLNATLRVNPAKTFLDNNMESSSQLQLHKEMFWSPTSKKRIISFDMEFIDFNFVEKGSTSEPISLRVSNNTTEKIKVKWILEKPINTSNLVLTNNLFAYDDCIFIIQPEEATIQKGGIYDFKVYFKPNKVEFYFYSDITCQATIMTNNEGMLKEINDKGYLTRGPGKKFLKPLQNKTMSSFSLNNKLGATLRAKEKMSNDYFDPPFSSKISLVGHSFPPGSQIFIPMFEFEPKKEIFFPPSTMNQSVYQTFKITNKSDTPLFYKIYTDEIPTKIGSSKFNDDYQIFKIHRQTGLIPAKDFHLICIEFAPKDARVYRVPLVIILNHDNSSPKKIMMNALCVKPVIELEGVKNEIYFPSSFAGLESTKKVNLINRSPIKINVNIDVIYDSSEDKNVKIQVLPNKFDLDTNGIKPLEIKFCPLAKEKVKAKIIFRVDRVYDSTCEFIGVFNPGSAVMKDGTLLLPTPPNKLAPIPNEDSKNNGLSSIQEENIINPEDMEKGNFGGKDLYFREVKIFGEGTGGLKEVKEIPKPNASCNDLIIETKKKIGKLRLTPTENDKVQESNSVLDFGTVKVGFFEKLSFSIYNPTMSNFFVTLTPKASKDEDNQMSTITFDFKKEGEMINALCRKEINVTFRPVKRCVIDMYVQINATINKKDADNENKRMHHGYNKTADVIVQRELQILANGNHPLIQIVDIRNDKVGTSVLWNNFNIDRANQILSSEVTKEESEYAFNERGNGKNKNKQKDLEQVRFDFGRHVVGSYDQKAEPFNVYLTLKNTGDVRSEFSFKFPDDISIKREIWMDPIEPDAKDKDEFRILKENIFEINDREGVLEPGKCKNIKLTYNKVCESRDGRNNAHKIRVIFQVKNGKPLKFELFAECFCDEKGILEIKKPLLDFDRVPIGYMDYLTSPLELTNVGGAKIKYKINEEVLDKFTQDNEFEVFKIENASYSIGRGERGYLIVRFKPLTCKEYCLNLNVYFTEDSNEFSDNDFFIPITIKGTGYLPSCSTDVSQLPPPTISIPTERVCNEFINKGSNEPTLIQKCGLSVEELDFGTIEDTESKTFIIYNFDNKKSFKFSIEEPGFKLTDEFDFGDLSLKDQTVEPGKHKLIKVSLTPKGYISNYDGEIEISIAWDPDPVFKTVEKEKLHIRIKKKSNLKEVSGTVRMTENENQCFVETLLTDLTRDILSDSYYQEFCSQCLEEQPMGIFRWSNDIPYPSHSNLREMNMKEYLTQAAILEDRTNNPNALNYTRDRSKKNEKNMKTSKVEPDETAAFSEAEDLKIQQKYMEELQAKYKLKVKEINESLAVVNEETRKLISNDIMQSTIYNIISEAVYEETDLTEKTRIYFFK